MNAHYTVVRSKCASYVGKEGILLQETQNTLKLICRDNKIRSGCGLSTEHCIIMLCFIPLNPVPSPTYPLSTHPSLLYPLLPLITTTKFHNLFCPSFHTPPPHPSHPVIPLPHRLLPSTPSLSHVHPIPSHPSTPSLSSLHIIFSYTKGKLCVCL